MVIISFTFIHRRYYIKNNITCFIPSISLYRLMDSFQQFNKLIGEIRTFLKCSCVLLTCFH